LRTVTSKFKINKWGPPSLLWNGYQWLFPWE